MVQPKICLVRTCDDQNARLPLNDKKKTTETLAPHLARVDLGVWLRSGSKERRGSTQKRNSYLERQSRSLGVHPRHLWIAGSARTKNLTTVPEERVDVQHFPPEVFTNETAKAVDPCRDQSSQTAVAVYLDKAQASGIVF